MLGIARFKLGGVKQFTTFRGGGTEEAVRPGLHDFNRSIYLRLEIARLKLGGAKQFTAFREGGWKG